MDAPKKKFKFSYHWVIFAVGFIMVFFVMGFNSSMKSTYLKAITEQLELKRSIFSLNETFRYFATAMLNLFFGRQIARYGARKLIAGGFICMILYCIISAIGTTYVHFFIASFFFGCGLAWTTTTIVGVLVEKWFTNGKGTVMGIILAANGIGGATAEQIVTRIIYGLKADLPVSEARWRLGYWVTAAILVVVGIFAVSFIRNTPEEMGIEPLGKNAVVKKKRGADWVGFEMEDIKKKKYFYVAAVCIFITGFCLNTFNGYSKPHMQDVGLANDFISIVFSAHAIVLTLSKILAGISFDKFGIRFTFAYCSVAAIVSLMALTFLNSQSTIAPFISGILSSIALPLETILIPLLVSEMFGKKCHAKIMGYFLGINTFGYAAGAPFVNIFFDIYGSYRQVFAIFCVVLAVNLIVIQIIFAVAKKDRIAYEAKLKEASEVK